MTDSIKIEVKRCKDCPRLVVERRYTPDSWEHAVDWFCEKADKRMIAGYIEWERDEPKGIPDWCPFRKLDRL